MSQAAGARDARMESSGVEMSTYLFSPEDMAVLFAVYEQPLPPIVEDVIREISAPELGSRVREFNRTVVSKGWFVETAPGVLVPSDAFGRVLAPVLNAERFVALENADGFVAAFYQSAGAVTRLSPQGDGFELAALDGRDGSGSGFFERAVHARPDSPTFASFEVGLRLGESGPLLKAFKAGDDAQLNAFCAQKGLEPPAVREYLKTAHAASGKDAGFRAVATRRDHAGVATTRIFDTQNGVTLMQWLVGPDGEALTYLARIPSQQLFAYLTDLAHPNVPIV